MKKLNENDIMFVSGGVVRAPEECANAMMASGGFAAIFGGAIGGLIGSLGGPVGTGFGIVLGSALFAGGGSAVAAQGSACEPVMGQCTAESGLQ